MYFFNCLHVFYRVYKTLYITACGLTWLLCTLLASLNAHVIFIIKETKSCIDIDGSCMLMNLQLRREGLQNDKMISVVPQYAYLKCVHQNCDNCSSYKS